jgi:RNA polymerase-binding transcription factor DksA
MVPTPQAQSTLVSAPEVGRLPDREAKLREARRFRCEQVASLEREVAADPRRETVKRALLMAARTALAEIDAALDRMARGAYGRCVTCAVPIPEDRLDELPMSALCMPCHFNEQNCMWTPPVGRVRTEGVPHVRRHA